MIESRSAVPLSNAIIPSYLLLARLPLSRAFQEGKCRVYGLDAAIKRTAVELLNRRVESDEMFRKFVGLGDAVAG